MIRIILLRHCETELNNENRYLGKEDVPLSNAGKMHAKLIAEKLKTINKSFKIYSSNLKRAYMTANVIAQEHSLEVEKLQGLDEINFGAWEEHTFNEILAKDKENAEEYLNNPSNFRFPYGETLDDLNERVLNALDSILKKHLNQNEAILMVAHAGPNRAILGKALNLSPMDQFRIKQDLGCVNVIDFFENAAIVALMNHTIDSGILNL